MSAPIERVAVGDILQLAPSLPPAQCIVTSPPYWGLRKYPIAPSLWGGDPNCRHNFASTPPPRQRAANDHGGGKMEKRGFVGVDIDPNFRRFVRETMRIHQMYTPLLQ